MAESIKDGGGTGVLAIVDDTQRLFTRAVSETPAHEAVVTEDHYIVSSGPVVLTTSNLSSVFYFKNDEDQDLFIDRLLVTSKDSTDGTEDYFFFSGTRNPTGMGSGSGTSLVQVNSNFGSTNLLDSTSEIGQEAATTTGGDTIYGANLKDARLHLIETRLLLQTGNSVAFEITPPAGNSSFTVTIAMNCHLVKP
jgi:hypothetical protein